MRGANSFGACRCPRDISAAGRAMASKLLSKLPSRDPDAFTCFTPGEGSRGALAVYRPINVKRANPPPEQVVTTERTNILLRQIKQVPDADKGKGKGKARGKRKSDPPAASAEKTAKQKKK